MSVKVGESIGTEAAYNYADSKVDNAKVADVAEQTAGSKQADDTAAVYEKSEETGNKATYEINKKSAADRAAIARQLKADAASREESLMKLVQDMMNKQAKTYGIANDEDAKWRFIASGNYTVDAETKAQAQKDIAEDGYWGVKQTSQRLFDFASALAGDDVEKMKQMQAAMQKGFKEATKSWGKELPSISGQTIDAANKLFDDYYKSKGVTE